MANSKAKNWAVGRWLIEAMDQWDRDYIDEEVRGYIEFDERSSGQFQFGYVQGQIDYRLAAKGTASPPSSSLGRGSTEVVVTNARGVVGCYWTAIP